MMVLSPNTCYLVYHLSSYTLPSVLNTSRPESLPRVSLLAASTPYWLAFFLHTTYFFSFLLLVFGRHRQTDYFGISMRTS